MGAGGTVGVGDGSAAVALAEGRVCVGTMETVAIGIAVAERVPVLMGVDNAVGFNVALGGLSVPAGVRAGAQPNRRKMSRMGQKRLVRLLLLITDTSICKRRYYRPLTTVGKKPRQTA